MPVTQGSEKSCKKSDDVIVAVKCMKVHGAKERNTIAFPDGKQLEHWRFGKVWEQNNRI